MFVTILTNTATAIDVSIEISTIERKQNDEKRENQANLVLDANTTFFASSIDIVWPMQVIRVIPLKFVRFERFLRAWCLIRASIMWVVYIAQHRG